MKKIHSAALMAALGLAQACASTDPRDYLAQCGAQAIMEEGRRVVRFDQEQAACADQAARNAQARNQRDAQAVAAGLALLALGAAAGAAAASPPPSYHRPPRQCFSQGSLMGPPGFRTYTGSTTCY